MPDYLAREEPVEAVFCNRVLHGHQRLHRARIGHLQDSFTASNVDLPVGQSTCRETQRANCFSSPWDKNISLSVFRKLRLDLTVLLPMKGRTRRYERGAECDGRLGAERRAAPARTAKSCGPGAPMQALSPREAEKLRAGDGGKRWFTKSTK